MAMLNHRNKLSRKELAYVFLGIVVLAFVLFGNGIKGQFVYDDDWVISRNPTVTQFSQIPKQFVSSYHYLQPETGLYRPLTIVSYTFNFLFGKSPAGFHVVNILIHALNVFLVFVLVFKLFNSKRLAYLTSLLFLFLPIHVEAVTFISGRADLLAFFFALTSLLLLFNERYWAGVAVFLLSLLSKESAVLFVPGVFVFWLWAYKKDNLKNIVKKASYFIAPAVIYGSLRYAALKNNFLANDASSIYNPLKFTDGFSRFYTALKVMTLYFWKTFAPLHLSADYSFNQISLLHSPFNYYVIFGLATLSAAVFVIFWKKTKTTALAFGAVVFFSSYFAVSNFIFPIGTIMAERIFYLPSLGIVLLAAFLLDKLTAWRFKNLWRFLVIIALVVYGFLTINRNQVWLNTRALFTDMVASSPFSAHAKTNLGIYYIKQDRWEEGKILFKEASAIAPEHLPLLDSLGIVAEHEKRYKDAEEIYLKTLSLQPHYGTALSNLGRLYFELGQYEKSADIYWREFGFQPKPAYLLVYAMSKSKLGKYDEAIDAIKKHFGENPQDLKLKFALGYAYYKKGDRATADKYFKESKNPAISDEEFIKSLEKF